MNVKVLLTRIAGSKEVKEFLGLKPISKDWRKNLTKDACAVQVRNNMLTKMLRPTKLQTRYAFLKICVSSQKLFPPTSKSYSHIRIKNLILTQLRYENDSMEQLFGVSHVPII